MNYNNYSGLRRANATCMLNYGIMDVILIGAYLIEFLKKSRTLSYFLVFTLLALVPYVICVIAYKKNQESGIIKYIMAGGFGIFYLFIIFTTTSPVAYVYAIMMAVVLMCYDHVKLMLIYMGGVTIGNIIQIGIVIARHQVKPTDLPDIEIRIASLVLFAVFMALGTLVSDKNNRIHLEQIEQEKEKIAEMMQQIIEVSEKMNMDIEVVSDKMSILGNTANKTKSSMQEVAQGTNETVESIQMQLEKTEEIQKTISIVEGAADTISRNVSGVRQELELSKTNIDTLIKHVHISNDANERVSRELEELYRYTNQMESIVKMINDVAEQTSLLSLNASIEAARAGEAGKGFAVVASEISALATQTQQATLDIATLIDNISRELSGVVKVIEQMINNANEQNEARHNTAGSFEQIGMQIERVNEESDNMRTLVEGLAQRNTIIVRGIETISAATEEVTAHSNETLEASEENNDITVQVGQIVENLSELAKELSALEE